MRAIVCHETVGHERLTLEEIDEPAPGPGEVLLDVAATGVNFADSLMVTGRYQERPPLPFVPGLEVAGRIVARGDGVADLAPGQRVLAMLDRGGFAERAVARAADVVPLPDDLDDVTAAGFAIAYGTALGALDWRAVLRPGETLLVHGAAGGGERAAVARAHGADEALDSERPDLVDALRAIVGRAGFDVVFDPVGGAMFEASLRTIAWSGRIVLVGFASGTVPQIPANILLVKNAAALGFYWGSYRKHAPARLREGFARLFAWHREGRLRPHVSDVLPLERTADAIGLLLARRSTGKVVVTTARAD